MNLGAMESPIPSGIYRHCKGNLYRVIGEGKHSETLEPLVLYEALDDNPDGKLWVRPLSSFTEVVEVGEKPQKRFEYLHADHRTSVGVGVIIERNETVLLQHRTGAHGEGTWSCPGGHIDFGETLEECARRETWEEVGLEVGAVTFHAITNDLFPDEKKHDITVWVRAEYIGGEPVVRSAREVTDVGWFPWNQLPEPLFTPLKNLTEGKGYTAVGATAPHARASLPNIARHPRPSR